MLVLLVWSYEHYDTTDKFLGADSLQFATNIFYKNFRSTFCDTKARDNLPVDSLAQ